MATAFCTIQNRPAGKLRQIGHTLPFWHYIFPNEKWLIYYIWSFKLCFYSTPRLHIPFRILVVGSHTWTSSKAGNIPQNFLRTHISPLPFVVTVFECTLQLRSQWLDKWRKWLHFQQQWIARGPMPCCWT